MLIIYSIRKIPLWCMEVLLFQFYRTSVPLQPENPPVHSDFVTSMEEWTRKAIAGISTEANPMQKRVSAGIKIAFP